MNLNALDLDLSVSFEKSQVSSKTPPKEKKVHPHRFNKSPLKNMFETVFRGRFVKVPG